MNIHEIKRRIKELGIDEKTIVFGRGCKKSDKGPGRKARYILSTNKSNTDIKYAIQFCRDINQYIVWKGPGKSYGGNYSVIAEDVPIADDDKVLSTQKGREFAWRDKEDVYTFSASGINTFIENYVGK